MPLISSTTLLRTLSIFHLTVAYTLLTNPQIIATQNLVVILGRALEIPSISTLLSPDVAHPAFVSYTPGSPALGLAALFLGFLGLSDLTALFMSDEIHNMYWAAQAAVRLAVLFAFEAWIYMTTPGLGQVAEGRFRGLKNDVVFSWAFVELVAMFWVFSTLREERKTIALKQLREKEKEKTLRGDAD